ncbi:hypothetical protein HNY73_001883 [Argiope bruennichi]|uniref:Uncharacterized protein n=1 Tax=Argiope bruennichi TaxID=94029 RepID=A0A8T0FUB3_ARGBR|nr:hypothetical protein HNY73_001883 [Argiope bruennichi]
MDEVEQDNAGTSEAVAKEATPSEESQKKAAASEKESAGESSKKTRTDYSVMSTRPYLDATVVPILLQALSALARERI